MYWQVIVVRCLVVFLQGVGCRTCVTAQLLVQTCRETIYWLRDCETPGLEARVFIYCHPHLPKPHPHPKLFLQIYLSTVLCTPYTFPLEGGGEGVLAASRGWVWEGGRDSVATYEDPGLPVSKHGVSQSPSFQLFIGFYSMICDILQQGDLFKECELLENFSCSIGYQANSIAICSTWASRNPRIWESHSSIATSREQKRPCA